MVTCQDIMDVMEEIAPRHLAEDWDNPGLLVGSPAARVERVFVCLDVSDAAVAQAAACGAQLIISHHPLIFRPLKALNTAEPLGRRIASLLAHGIAAFAAHTNLDIAEGGVNDVLARAVGLSHLSAFVITAQAADGHTQSLGRVGTLEAPMRIEDFAARVRAALPGVELDGVHSGLHFLLTLPGAGGERAMVAAAAQQGVRLRGLSEYYLARPELCRADTVVAGYSALKEDDVEKVAQALARAWLS